MLTTLLHMMKGTPYIVQGEELGMKNVPFEKVEDYQDIETQYFLQLMKEKGEPESYIKESMYLKSRDNARTPFPWNGDANDGYGFSPSKPWIAYSSDNQFINAESALEDEGSVFYYYKQLIALRHQLPIIVHGDYELINESDSNVYSYLRTYENQTLLVVCSFADKPTYVDLPKELLERSGRCLIHNYPKEPSSLNVKQELQPYEAFVYLFD